MWYFSLFFRKKVAKKFVGCEKSSTFALQSNDKGYLISKDNPMSYIRLHVLTTCDATTLPKVEGRNDGYSYTIVYAAHGYHIATYCDYMAKTT